MKSHLYSKIPLAQTIVALCKAKQIAHIVISPGSRNAPLTIGFTEHPEMNCYSIVDERCAAFFALGMAQQLQQPVALVCTSGSALLNYYPAIAEAYYSDVPLVILSADRPIERIDIGDGQTIRQKNVFANHILYAANLYSEVVAAVEIKDTHILQKQREAQKHNEREINLALNAAISQQGPVHINVPFYEPLYDKVSTPTVQPKNIPLEQTIHPISEPLITEMQSKWMTSKRKIILIGVNPPKGIDSKWIALFAQDPSVLVLTETTSNVHHSSHIHCIDQFITPLTTIDFEALQPEILLTFGGLIISKRIKAFLRTYQPDAHWHIDEKKAFDTYFCLTEHIKTTPNIFFDAFFKGLTNTTKSDYKAKGLAIRAQRIEKHRTYLSQIPFSDFKAYETIFKAIPKGQMIQLSNSSTVRYAQLFDLDPSFQVFCNRGTSGIDGSTATAIGAALASGIPTTLLTGDLSFFYDSNALWNTYIPKNLKIIIINNSGGGIFRILPGNDNSDTFNQFFETTHELNASHLAKMYGFEYQGTQNLMQLKEALQHCYNEDTVPQIVEVFTPRTSNDRVLIDYFKRFV